MRPSETLPPRDATALRFDPRAVRDEVRRVVRARVGAAWSQWREQLVALQVAASVLADDRERARREE